MSTSPRTAQSLSEALGADLVTDGGMAAITLGANLLTGTDTDMSGANNWDGSTFGTFDINNTVADKAYMLGDAGSDYMTVASLMPTPKHYFMSLKARLNAGASTVMRMGGSLTTSPKYFEFTPTGTEATYSAYQYPGGSGTLALYIGRTTGELDGIAMEIDDVNVQLASLTSWQNWIPQVTSGALTGKAYKLGATTTNLEQSTTAAEAGKAYRITWTLDKIAGDGGDGITCEFGSTDGTFRTVSGTHVDNIIATDTDFLKFKSTDDGTNLIVTIDDVSVQEITRRGIPD